MTTITQPTSATHAFDTAGPRRLPVHARVRGAPDHVRQGRRHRAVGRRRQALPRLPRRPRRRSVSATPTRSSPRPSPTRPASCCTCRNLFANPVATRAAMEIDRLLAETTGQLGQVFFTNSGAEANECAHQAGPQARRPRPPRRRQRPRQLPRPHAGVARGDRPADEARAVPADARGLPPRRVGRHRRPRQGRRRLGRPPC